MFHKDAGALRVLRATLPTTHKFKPFYTNRVLCRSYITRLKRYLTVDIVVSIIIIERN